MKKTGFFFTLLLGAAMLQAQEIELDPVTITASLSRQKSSQTGRNITIIKGEVFQKLPVQTLDELLRYIPGIEIQARGPKGSQSDIVLRGGTFQQVLVILDGMRLNDPNTGHFSSYIPIAPSEIERIEVLKGASSAIHGADAVGGVINIITKSFSVKEAEHRLQTNASVAAGEYGYLNGEAGVNYSGNKLNLSAGLVTNKADGVLQRGARGFFNNTTFSTSVNYRLTEKWNIAYRFAHDSRDFAAQNYYTTFASDTASEQVTTRWHQIRIGYQTEKESLTLDAGYKSLTDIFYFTPASIPNNSKSALFQALLMYQRKLGDRTTLVTGVNYQNKNIQSNDRGEHSLYLVSPFISLSQQLWRGFHIRPSAQWVAFKNIRSEIVPQLDFSQKISNWQLRGSVGKTIRDADFTERYNNYGKNPVTSGRVGNPSLLTETSVSYEAGADWFWQNRLKVSGGFFQRFHKRLIDYSTTPYADMPRKDNLVPGGMYALAKNIAEVNTAGAELDLQYMQQLDAGQSLTAAAGLVWLNSASSDTVPSFYISSHAKFLANFALIYQCHGLTFSINGLFKQRQQQEALPIYATITPDYFVMNAKAEYRFYGGFSAFVQADNLFNRKYSDLLGTPMPGRWVLGGLRFNLDTRFQKARSL